MIARTTLLLLAFPLLASAQKASCGAPAVGEHDLEFVANMFTSPDSDMVAFRADVGIKSLPVNVPRRIVTDSRTCNRILAATRAQLLKGSKGPPDNLEHITFGFYRVGEYFVALEVFEPPKDLVLNGRSLLLVFRASDMAFVAQILA